MDWKLDTGSVQLTNLSHVGIVVKDAEKTVVVHNLEHRKTRYY